DHLACQGIELVVMEATSDYWRPFFYQLEARGLRVWLVNARDVKNVPGRPKTDKLDAIWLAKLAEHGMLRPSLVPPNPIRQPRGRMRVKIPRLVEALTGQFEDHHAYLIRILLEDHDRLSTQIEELSTRIEQAIAAIDPTPPPDDDHPARIPLLDRLDEIPGVG